MVKKYKKQDPHRSREQKKYKHPVPSREHILRYLKEVKKPVELDSLLAAFELTKEKEVEGFVFRIKAMLRDGQIKKNRKGGFVPLDQSNLQAGIVLGHADGFGFIQLENGDDDVFVSEKEMRALFVGDKVLIQRRISKSRRREEAHVVKVLKRNTTEIVGRLVVGNGSTYVQPDDRKQPQRVLLSSSNRQGANPDDFVVIKITKQPTRNHLASGEIIKVIGNDLTPGLEIDLAVMNHKIPFEWPKAVLKQARQFSKKVAAADCENRLDLRELPFVTIDGEDAKDFDDAVFCQPQDKGWVLYVAIADVAHYVKPGSALDKEAYQRGNSVYFPGSVVPMLPEVLSNGLCSLRPKVDRLTMVAKLEINAKGELTNSSFHNAVIHSHARLTYTQVAEMLDKQKEHALLPALNHLHQLYQQLLARRIERGALDFTTTETKILFNDFGKIDKIVPTERNQAHRIIEECMLMANVAVANYLEKSKLPTLFRVHELPQQTRIDQLRDFLKLFAIPLAGGNAPSSKDFAEVLQTIEKRPDAHLLQITVLRTLSQAVYKSSNDGHFGLAYEGYTHFTSPIRRYPDLMVHRALKWALNQDTKKSFAYTAEDVTDIALHCSQTERRADLATREAVDRLKCDFMENKVGNEFSGKIVDVTNFGVFVELDQFYVQGLVHITSLKKDYYRFDEVQRVLKGEKTNVSFRLGQPVKIIVSRVDKDRRFIDFDLA